jgi:hypothetical protein
VSEFIAERMWPGAAIEPTPSERRARQMSLDNYAEAFL